MFDFVPKSIYYPREAVEDKFNRGELDALYARLGSFVERHAADIWEVAMEETQEPSDDELLDATQLFILSKGTIHPPSEMAEQIREINKEVWYRGEEGNHNTRRIAEEWQEKYAGKWREARLFECFFLMRRFSQGIVGTLRGNRPIPAAV